MDYSSLLSGLPPLYLLVVLGFLAGRKGLVEPLPLAQLLIWFCSPSVVLLGTLKADLSSGLLFLPAAIWPIATLMGVSSLLIGRRLWSNGTERIAAFASGTGNTGYFGIPVCLAVLGSDSLPYVVAISFGFTAYEVSVGYFMVARDQADWRAAVTKTISLPALHAFWIGLACNAAGINLPDMVITTLDYGARSLSFLGMLIIGVSLSNVRASDFDLKLNGYLLAVKFVAWPVLAYGIIRLEAYFFGRLPDLAQATLLVESLVPVAANTVAYATQLGVQAKAAALLVLTSTLLAIFILPLALPLLFPIFTAP